MRPFRAWLAAVVLIAAGAPTAAAQALHGVVVDQTELPLPGATVQLVREGAPAGAAVVTAANGTYEISGVEPGDHISVALDGFESAIVPVERASRIVLMLARTTLTTEVHASPLASSGAAMEKVGSSLLASEMIRLPAPHPRALETVTRLPAVVRGRDGTLHIGGTPPDQSQLLIDGFDMSDPATGLSAIDLPIETVKGVAVIRDPMSATFGRTLGGLASIETIAGPDRFTAGVQGFVPRPRLSKLGFGRIEAFFPRAYVGGRAGRIRYLAAGELSFERVPVPGVTTHSGSPNIGEIGATIFGRLDVELSSRHALSFDTIFVPAHRDRIGLSPLRDESAAPSSRTRDLFFGAVDRILLGASDVVTLRAGALAHGTALSAPSRGVARLTPFGWRDNWFSTVDHWATRQSLAVDWDHTGLTGWGSHVVTTSIDVKRRAMDASIDDNPIRVEDADGRAVRTIAFAGASRFRVTDLESAGVVRDLWDVNRRLQVDVGARVDWFRSASAPVVSPRLAVRYHLDEAGTTTLKAGAGRFVGRTPLPAVAFDRWPARIDTILDDGGAVEVRRAQPFRIGTLALPRADSFVLELERQFGSGVDVQAGFRHRTGSRLPTVVVPGEAAAPVLLDSRGRSTYGALELAVRRSWGAKGQAFASYVHAVSRSEVNDFATLFTNLDTPLLQPGGRAPAADDVPHRLVTWGTFSLPERIVVSPALDWRSGFPYTALDRARRYAGPLNGRRFPPYFSIDLTVYKGFDIADREVNLGLQVFDLTGHFNPRDVYAVQGTPRAPYTNSLGRTFGGYIVVEWNSREKRESELAAGIHAP